MSLSLFGVLRFPCLSCSLMFIIAQSLSYFGFFITLSLSLFCVLCLPCLCCGLMFIITQSSSCLVIYHNHVIVLVCFFTFTLSLLWLDVYHYSVIALSCNFSLPCYCPCLVFTFTLSLLWLHVYNLPVYILAGLCHHIKILVTVLSYQNLVCVLVVIITLSLLVIFILSFLVWCLSLPYLCPWIEVYCYPVCVLAWCLSFPCLFTGLVFIIMVYLALFVFIIILALSCLSEFFQCKNPDRQTG